MTNHINGSQEEILARYCITELCKGWPVYRDASEWQNYRSIFTKEGAYVWTSRLTLNYKRQSSTNNDPAWSGGLAIDDFIDVSIKGRAKGDFIMHRENGTLANVNLTKQRGIGKMKATITQRFTNIQGIPVDIECDCRFIFFTKIENGERKAQYVRLFYEKDKMVAVNGKDVPVFPQEVLDQYTEGYKYLAAAQHSLGHSVLKNLPNPTNKGWQEMYAAMADWLDGKDINLFWERTS